MALLTVCKQINTKLLCGDFNLWGEKYKQNLKKVYFFLIFLALVSLVKLGLDTNVVL